uniref:Uncharacterized protein n=1 Tax=Ditylenchus dipsaci TaxID=166011 RepID=A0A915E1X7_9BILA
MLSEETVKRSKLEHDLKATNAEWMKRRGRLEPRTAIDHCERCKFGPLGITVDSNNRSKHWEVLWEKPDFEEFKKLALEGSSIPSAYNKARKFGNSVVVPRGFTPDQKIVLRAICSFIPVDCEEESSLL